MLTAERKVALITSMGKKYVGMIDMPNKDFRTTDLFNSANIFWKNPAVKCYDDAIYMRDVSLFIDGESAYKEFDTIQVKLSSIIFFYDEIEQIYDETEKKRAGGIMTHSDESGQEVTIVTSMVANSFYTITGYFSRHVPQEIKGPVCSPDEDHCH